MRSNKPRSVTLKQVAQHAGVSQTTASLVLNDSPSIPESTRQKIFAAIKELGYIYDRSAANLRSKSPSAPGLLLSDLDSTFSRELLCGVQTELTKKGQTVLFGASFGSLERQEQLIGSMLEQRVGGMILSLAPNTPLSAIERIRRLGITVILIGDNIPEAHCDCLSLDNRQGGKLATEFLLDKGHRQIALLGGATPLSAWQGIWQGHQTALRKAGITPNDSLRLAGPATCENGFFLAQKALSSPNKPTAFLCCNDAVALGAVTCLKESGLQPGMDVVAIRLANSAETTAPTLNNVVFSPRLLGCKAAQLLHNRLSGLDTGPQTILLPPELQVRTSGQPEICLFM